MDMPGFAAEASLYKAAQLYRGHSGASRVGAALSVIAQQFPNCDDWCNIDLSIAIAGCTAAATIIAGGTGGVLAGPAAAAYILCLGTASGKAVECHARCPPSSPPPPPITGQCPTGKLCCDSPVCNVCVPPGHACPCRANQHCCDPADSSGGCNPGGCQAKGTPCN